MAIESHITVDYRGDLGLLDLIDSTDTDDEVPDPRVGDFMHVNGLHPVEFISQTVPPHRGPPSLVDDYWPACVLPSLIDGYHRRMMAHARIHMDGLVIELPGLVHADLEDDLPDLGDSTDTDDSLPDLMDSTDTDDDVPDPRVGDFMHVDGLPPVEFISQTVPPQRGPRSLVDGYWRNHFARSAYLPPSLVDVYHLMAAHVRIHMDGLDMEMPDHDPDFYLPADVKPDAAG
jgi:hypothetical protein